MTKSGLFFRSLGQGKPLLILHGILGSSEQWLPIANELSAYRKIIIPDMPNHALSPHIATMTFDDIAKQIAVFILENNLENLSILGHSWGGKVAIQLLENFSSRLAVEKLILCDISPKSYPLFEEHRQWIMAVKETKIEHYKSFGEISEVLKKFVPDRKMALLLVKNMCKKDGHLQWKSNMKGIVDNFDDVLASTFPSKPQEIPTLLLKGENSKYVSEEDIQLMREFFPNLTFATLPNAGHWLHADNPNMFVAAVLDFLKDNLPF